MTLARSAAVVRWAGAAAAALVIVAALLYSIRAPQSLPKSAAGGGPALPAVELTKGGGNDLATSEELIMNDQTPLFLPTDRNVAVPRVRRPDVGQSVIDQDAVRVTFGEADLKLALPDPVKVAAAPADVILQDAVTPLHGFGQVDESSPPLPARGGYVEVVSVETNRQMLGEPLVQARPPAGKTWRPMEFLAAVDAAGLVAPLVISERSDVEEVESYFQTYLAKTFRIGERLPPGFYRVIVGP